MASKALSHQDYSVGWVCALTKERVAATVILDQLHPVLSQPASDFNTYTLGSIGDHNIAIASLPEGDIGNNPAATVATRMTSTFPLIKFWLMVGIGGGVPPKVRLGDVVVSVPVYDSPGIVQWDLGIAQSDSFKHIGVLNKAPEALRTAIPKLKTQHEIEGSDQGILSVLEEVQSKYPTLASKYLRPEQLKDVLFRADYDHVRDRVQNTDDRGEEENNDDDNDSDDDDDGKQDGASDCRYCDETKAIKRKPRKSKIKIHYGLIASGNSVIKNARQRDEINQQLKGLALCFEMEAAGISNSHPCLVIRGICDYSDTHKNYRWQRYAAFVAAAFAKELLKIVPPSQVNLMRPAVEVFKELKDGIASISASQHDQRSLLVSVEQHQSQTEIDRQLSKLPIAQDAAFNSSRWQHAAYCLEDTRVDLLEHIKRWSNVQGPHIFWLSGVAGSGKSTIARTIASAFSEQGCLGASFFFSRGEGDLSHAGKFVTTLAQQLVESQKDLRSCLSAAISTRQSVISQGLRDQWKAFVLGPLSKLQSTFTKSQKLVFVVDAMDECDQEDDIKLILQLFRGIPSHLNKNLRLCVTSRPETYIRLGFSSMPEILHKDLNLGSVPRHIVEHDIAVFLDHELHRLGEKHALPNWPSDENIGQLTKKCDLLFIYAATICRFIDDDNDRPNELLAMILQNDSAEEPLLLSLDEMYIKILKHCITRNRVGVKLERAVQLFQNVIGSFIVLFSTLSISAISVLLDTDIEKVGVAFNPLHSLIYVPPEQHSPLHTLHPSFRDFLLDKRRCSEDYFYIQPEIAHIHLTQCCVRLLGKFLRKDMCNLKNPGSMTREVSQDLIHSCIPEHVQYACRYWIDHLSHISDEKRYEAGLYENGEIHNFLRTHFLYWLEAMSLLKKMSECVKLTAKLKSLHTRLDHTQLSIFLNDATRFVLSYTSMIGVAPLQVYIGALIFSPSKSTTRKLFEQEIPDWISLKPQVPKEWSAVLQTLEGHFDSVRSVMFSRDGQKIVSGSDDKTVRVWEAASGLLLQTLEGHSDKIYSVMFSQDGQKIVSGSDDETIRVWETASGSLLQTLEGHSGSISSVVFSQDDQKIVSGSSDKTLRVWETASGSLLQTLRGHSYRVYSVAFSQDGQKIASGSDDETVRIWDTTSGLLSQTLDGHSSWIYSVAFSRDDQKIVSGSGDKTVRIWKTASGSLLQTLKGHSGWVYSVAFSRDGRKIVSGSSDKTLRVWEAASGSLLQTLEGHSDRIYSVAFSRDGQKIVSGSDDKTLRIWEAASESEPPLQTLEGHSDRVYSVAFSRSGQKIVSGSYDKTVRLWRAASGLLLQTLKGHSGWVGSVAFSRDGQKIVSGSTDETVRIWETASGLLLQTLKGHSDWIHSVTFSRDDQKIVSGSYDKTVRIWGAASGVLLQTLEGYSRSTAIVLGNPGEIVSVQDCWISIDQVKAIFLPESRRAHACASSGSKLAIGSSSGIMTILRFNITKFNSVRATVAPTHHHQAALDI